MMCRRWKRGFRGEVGLFAGRWCRKVESCGLRLESPQIQSQSSRRGRGKEYARELMLDTRLQEMFWASDRRARDCGLMRQGAVWRWCRSQRPVEGGE